jgi:poly(A) polymerase
VAIDRELFRYLEGLGTVFESQEGDIARYDAINILEIIVSSWVSSVGTKKGMPVEATVNGGGVQLRVYGSQRLGVHSTNADIDMLCIAPCYVTREDFFTSFVEVLQQFGSCSQKGGDPAGASVSAEFEDICARLRVLQVRTGQSPSTDLGADLEGCVAVVAPIRDAYTPVIKFSLHNISVDMIFASLPGFYRVPLQLDILDSRCLCGLDDKSVRSLNGSRVTERILQLVPSVPSFCMALRAIKHWARQRGIYSNILGFLGGVNYAIMVAFVCQRYVNACPSAVVRNFFRLFCQWRWPNPVMLTGLECESVLMGGPDSPQHGPGAGPLGLPSGLNPDTAAPLLASSAAAELTRVMPPVPVSVWNPQLNHRDVTHLMPIITPCYPAMNSTYNVGAPQFRLLQQELQRAHNLFVQMEMVRPAMPPTGPAVQKPGDPVVELPAPASPVRRPPSDISSISWATLCLPATMEFFERHCRYLQIDISATSELQQRVWFGWCESRLRLLLNSLEQPPFMFCHPFGNCFNRQTPRGDWGKNDKEAGGVLYTSSFFIGLSFRAGLRRVDISPSIVDFRNKILQWVDRRPGMNLAISLLGRDAIPSFVHEVVAEPSSQSGCTPAKSKPFSTTPTKARSPSAAQSRKLFSQQVPSPVPVDSAGATAAATVVTTTATVVAPALAAAGTSNIGNGNGFSTASVSAAARGPVAESEETSGRESPEFSIYFARDDSPPRTAEKTPVSDSATTTPASVPASQARRDSCGENADFVELLVTNSKGQSAQEPTSAQKKKTR